MSDRQRRRHRAPARPYTLAWLHQFKRLATRWEYRADIHYGLLRLACCLICWRYLGRSS